MESLLRHTPSQSRIFWVSDSNQSSLDRHSSSWPAFVFKWRIFSLHIFVADAVAPATVLCITWVHKDLCHSGISDVWGLLDNQRYFWRAALMFLKRSSEPRLSGRKSPPCMNRAVVCQCACSEGLQLLVWTHLTTPMSKVSSTDNSSCGGNPNGSGGSSSAAHKRGSLMMPPPAAPVLLICRPSLMTAARPAKSSAAGQQQSLLQ